MNIRRLYLEQTQVFREKDLWAEFTSDICYCQNVGNLAIELDEEVHLWYIDAWAEDGFVYEIQDVTQPAFQHDINEQLEVVRIYELRKLSLKSIGQ